MNRDRLIASAGSQLRKLPKLARLLARIAQAASPETVALLNYPIHQKQRWDLENPHQGLHEIINRNRELYQSYLQEVRALSEYFTAISERQEPTAPAGEPCWINGWMPALDGVALYGFLVAQRPKLFMEVGSGNSTMFARKAIADHGLETEIVSIDPHPRAEIDALCDEVIRRPAEEVDTEIFSRLGRGDILYIDSSHRVFMNSDVTALFLDVIPLLKPGVLVEIHDILLPYDYPKEWIDWYVSEQYLLAAYLLAKGDLFDIVLPTTFISHDAELSGILTPLWEREEMRNVERHGCSFWLRMK
jgi:hypothetical protein